MQEEEEETFTFRKSWTNFRAMSFSDFCSLMKKILLLLFDGLGFFGFDDTKLPRLKGEPVTFLSKLSSARWVILTLFSFIGACVIIILEAIKYGDLESQSLDLVI